MKDKDFLLFIGIGALLIAATGTVIYMGARGIRNNNPGNIRHGGSQWQGMSAQQTDPEYVQFDDPAYGIRALALLLKNYQARYGLNTVRGIIDRWAPPSENLTGAYIAHVAKRLGVTPDQPINVQERLVPLVESIILHENGINPYPADLIAKGVSLA